MGINDLEYMIRMNDYYDLKVNLLNPNHAMAAALKTICHIPKYTKAYRNLAIQLKNYQNFGASLMLGLFYQGNKDYNNSFDIYEKLESQFDKLNNDSVKAYVMSIYYPTIYAKDNKNADQSFKNGIDNLVRLGTIVYIHAPFHTKGWSLLHNSKEDKLSEHLQHWLDIVKDEDIIPLDYYQPLMIINEILKGEKENALHRLRRFEARFEGANVIEYKKLYDWLIKNNTYPKFTKRYQLLSNTIDSICNVDKTLNKKSNYKSDKFLDFMLEWQKCIHLNRDFDKSILNGFFQNERQKECLMDSLSVWDIKFTELGKNEITQNTKIEIQLFGKPQLMINENLLPYNDWESKKAFELFIFIIIKGWKFKKNLQKDLVIFQIWGFAILNPENKKNNLNSCISKMRKTLHNSETQLIISEQSQIGFDWENTNYTLDIDDFYQSFIKGKEAIQLNEKEKGIAYLKHGINVYSGYLGNNIRSEWIEEIRATFHNYYLECLTLLTTHLPDKENQKLLKSEQLKFPDEDIEEYLK